MRHRLSDASARPGAPLLAIAIAVVVALATVLPASANLQYMDLPGCIGSGWSEVYGDTTANGVTDGCSGSQTYIVSTAYSGGNQYQCPFNWTWYSGDTWCTYSAGVGSLYGTHRMLYSGAYSSYVYTSD